MRKRAILLDIDGTLVDSNHEHVDAWRRALLREGYVFSETQIQAQIGKGGDNLVPALVPGAKAELADRLSAQQGRIFRRDFRSGVRPFEGAVAALKKFATLGHTLVLASSASAEDVSHYVNLLEADGVISGFTSKDDVRSSKPNPDIFEAALRLTGEHAENAIVIGDSPYDITSARRARLDSIALLSGGFPQEKLASCNPVAIYETLAVLADRYENSPLC